MKKSVLVFIILILSIGCNSRMNIKQDPFYKTFFEKTKIGLTIKIEKKEREKFILLYLLPEF